MASVINYVKHSNTSRPAYSPGDWNVGKVLSGQSYIPTMLVAWCSKETAEWWLRYYDYTYPQFKFCLIGRK